MTEVNYNYQNSFRFSSLVYIYQSHWVLSNNGPNSHTKTANWLILVLVVTLISWEGRSPCWSSRFQRDVWTIYFLSGKYGDDLRESSKTVKHMWTVLSQFSSDERSRFLRFVTGRKRPPAPFTVAKAGGDKDSLPHASTCASTLFLPDYSSAAIAKEKLRLAAGRNLLSNLQFMIIEGLVKIGSFSNDGF